MYRRKGPRLGMAFVLVLLALPLTSPQVRALGQARPTITDRPGCWATYQPLLSDPGFHLLKSIAGSSSNDVWAVGIENVNWLDAGTPVTFQPALLKLSGAAPAICTKSFSRYKWSPKVVTVTVSSTGKPDVLLARDMAVMAYVAVEALGRLTVYVPPDGDAG